jgi:hypothetical protein
MSLIHAGFKYLVNIIRDGAVIDSFEAHNLMPTEGQNHMLSTEYKSGTPVGTWYVGLFEGNYTPVLGDTAAAFPAAATECTAYVLGTRTPWVPGTVAGGILDNTASVSAFTMNATKTVYGGFVSSAAAKGAVTGVLTSVVRFPSPKPLLSGDILQVTAGITLTSA